MAQGIMFNSEMLDTDNVILTQEDNKTLSNKLNEIDNSINNIELTSDTVILPQEENKTLTTKLTEQDNRIEEVFTNVSNGKNLIASAITDKGVATSSEDTFNTMSNNIKAISNNVTLLKSTAEGPTYTYVNYQSGSNITEYGYISVPQTYKNGYIFYAQFGDDSFDNEIAVGVYMVESTNWDRKTGGVPLRPQQIVRHSHGLFGDSTFTLEADQVIIRVNGHSIYVTYSIWGF